MTDNKKIKVGYKLGTRTPVHIKPSHLITTGITQLSGKTTMQEGAISRRGGKAIVFKTKIGETGFTKGHLIPPYFKERSDWQYVSSLLEATLREKLKFERAWIIRVCKNTDSLHQVKINIENELAKPKLRFLSRSVYETLKAYLELILPQLEYANFSRTLKLSEGINIMDLERYSEEIQSLIIRSVLEEVLHNYSDVLVVMPEAWKFLPQGRGNPAKRIAESFIRQGATNGNFLWIDCQDMAGVDKIPLKQVSTWILGLQQERNEVKHTLDQIPLPKKSKPKAEEIMTLKLGHFILVTPEKTIKIYAQPSWVPDKTAVRVAMGEIDPTTLTKPESLIERPLSIEGDRAIGLEERKFYANLKKDLVALRHDFFDKIKSLSNRIDVLGKGLSQLDAEIRSAINIEEIVSLVLQKMKVPTTTQLDMESVVKEVLRRIPKGVGSVVYKVSPLEKLRKDFQQYARDHIITDVSGLDAEGKKMLKFIESVGKGTNRAEIMEKCLFINPASGSKSRIQKKLQNMAVAHLIRKDRGGHIFANLKDRAKELMEVHGAKPEEIEAVYNHVIKKVLGE